MMYVYMRIRIHTSVCMHVRIYIYTWTHVHLHVYIYREMHVYKTACRKRYNNGYRHKCMPGYPRMRISCPLGSYSGVVVYVLIPLAVEEYEGRWKSLSAQVCFKRVPMFRQLRATCLQCFSSPWNQTRGVERDTCCLILFKLGALSHPWASPSGIRNRPFRRGKEGLLPS